MTEDEKVRPQVEADAAKREEVDETKEKAQDASEIEPTARNTSMTGVGDVVSEPEEPEDVGPGVKVPTKKKEKEEGYEAKRVGLGKRKQEDAEG